MVLWLINGVAFPSLPLHRHYVKLSNLSIYSIKSHSTHTHFIFSYLPDTSSHHVNQYFRSLSTFLYLYTECLLPTFNVCILISPFIDWYLMNEQCLTLNTFSVCPKANTCLFATLKCFENERCVNCANSRVKAHSSILYATSDDHYKSLRVAYVFYDSKSVRKVYKSFMN